jgi:hypothetical protein
VGTIESIDIEENGAHQIETDFFHSAFGLTPKLGPIETGDLRLKRY